MTTRTVDHETGEVIDIEDVPERAVLPYVEAPRGLARAETPQAMIELASALATALRDIVDRQQLYTMISNRKYPNVEAWMTVARLDNVVAREVSAVRRDDGAYEATVELVRLSDGMMIGRGTALCGATGDRPWDSRPEHQRRSMSVTRATSRAFRQQYSWIMALAGYEPTPADEMPHEDAPARPEPTQRPAAAPPAPERHEGTVAAGKPPVDLELRETPDGWACGFALVAEGRRLQVVALDAMALALHPFLAAAVGQKVTVWGRIEFVPWDKDGKTMPPFRRLHLERIEAPEFTIPAAV